MTDSDKDARLIIVVSDRILDRAREAERIAKQLGKRLQRVLGKYVGETEKNLARLFDAAERSGAILFFDEADALFGKRTEVRDSHDRYANTAIDDLLKVAEQHSAVIICAVTAIDEATLPARCCIERVPQKRPEIDLRDITEADLPILFEQQRDPEGIHMAAFTPKDPGDLETFTAKWRKILAQASVVKKAIVVDGDFVGNVVCFDRLGRREIGYWIDRAHWGRGIATAAVALFVQQIPTRPLFACAAYDNHASVRVLQRTGFELIERERGFAAARDEEIEELVLRLEEEPQARPNEAPPAPG